MKAYLFTYLCIFCYFVFSYTRNKKCLDFNTLSSNKRTLLIVRRFLFVIFIVCLVPMLYYYYRLISSSLVAKYGSREFDSITSDTGYLLSLLRKWGIISLVGLTSTELFIGKKSRLVFTLGFYFIVLFLSLLSGSRSEGISMLLIFIFVLSLKHKKSKPFKIIVIVSLIFVSLLIPFFYVVRGDISKVASLKISDFLSIKYVFSALHEMGGSEAPLLLVMQDGQLLFGKSIVAAGFNSAFNFLPSSIRPDLSWFAPHSLADYYSRLLKLEYGLGFSLAAEAYLNFSWIGCLLFGFMSAFLRKIYFRKMDMSSFVGTLLFVFLILTMPRRETKDLFLSLIYYWLPFEIVLGYIRSSGSYRKAINNGTINKCYNVGL